MAEKIGKEPSDVIAPFGFQAMMEMQRPAFTAVAELNGKLYESIAAVNREWASLINRRLKEDLAVPQQLAECKTVQDLYRVYAQFFENACAHYQSGFEQMSKLGRSITENAIQSLQSHSDDTARTKH